MITASTTLTAIDAKVKAGQGHPFRAHLGGSVIGDDCARRVWYQWRWAKDENFNGRMLRLFERGQLEESRFVGFLRSIGIEVWETDPDAPLKGGKPQQFRISGHCGHYGGSLDGVGRGLAELPPGTPFLLEFKTHSDKSFKKLKEEGIIKTKWKHFVQMQQYMGEKKLKYALYCAVNKNDDELYMEIVGYDQVIYLRYHKLAGQIIWAEAPPPRVSKSPAYFGCKFCHLARLCHFGDVQPDRNCRTCQHSSPAKGGTGDWVCGHQSHKASPMLDEPAQIAACPNYSVKPELMGVQP